MATSQPRSHSSVPNCRQPVLDTGGTRLPLCTLATVILDFATVLEQPQTSEGQRLAKVSLHRMTSIPFPVKFRVAYADGTREDFSLPVSIWARTNKFDAVVPVRGTVTGVRLWPDPSVPDWNPANDTWGNPPPANVPGPVTRK